MVNNEQIRALVREIEPALIEIRHQLHRHPELSSQEFHTAGRIEETLRRWGVEYRRNGSDAVMNDPRLTELFLQGAAELLGAENVSVTPAPYMGSDNFARYGKFAPSVYFSLGIQKPDAETVHGLHSPFFTADDAAIRTGTAALTRGALDFLSHLEV